MKNLGLTDSEFASLEKVVNKKKSYILSDVESKIEKVAFDVVRFKDDDLSHLWQIQKSSDGTEIIVAMYDEPELTVESKKEWAAIPDKSANIHVFYKGEAIYKLASGMFNASDVDIVCRTLTSSLSSDRAFVNALVQELSPVSRDLVLQKYPELKDL
jgi:hypothetical protein